MGVKNPDGADYGATQAQTGFRPSPGGHGEVLYFVGQGRKNLEVRWFGDRSVWQWRAGGIGLGTS